MNKEQTKDGRPIAACGASVSIVELGSALTFPNASSTRLILPVTIYFNPRPDITAYELARLLPILIRRSQLMPSEVPKEPELLRHIEVHDPNAEVRGRPPTETMNGDKGHD